MRSKESVLNGLSLLALGSLVWTCLVVPVMAQEKVEKSNMELVGYNDLQGRDAHHITVQKQGERWIAYIGDESRGQPKLNTLTGQVEPGGTSIVDVTDPKNSKFIAHIPGQDAANGGGSAEYVRTCSGSDLPHADKSKFYLLRPFGFAAWEIWDVTDPSRPNRLVVIPTENTERPWWECDTGIAYLIGETPDWNPKAKLIDGMDPPKEFWSHDADAHVLIYDLSDPTKPVFIRGFGLPGQQVGSSVPHPIVGPHTVMSTGPKGNRVYIGNGNAGNGIVLIVDRNKLLNGPKEPTDENLRYPVIGRIDLPPDMGANVLFPLLQMPLPEFAHQTDGYVKDFLAVTGQGHKQDPYCHQSRQMLRIFDITTESKPVGVSTWTVPEASGDFCKRGGQFGTHGTNESFTPIYYKRVLFVAFNNAGVRALDIRDPYNPKEIGYYIPAVTKNTDEVCYGSGKERQCPGIAIGTNHVDLDDRGYIYIVDHSGTGMHILELTGPARKLADFAKAGAPADIPSM